MKYLIPSLLVILLTAMAFFLKGSMSMIPNHWQKGMHLSYDISHGLSREFRKYEFLNDSVHVHTRTINNIGHQEDRYNKALTSMQLNGLLSVLKSNRADKMKTRKTDRILYDGSGFSLQLRIDGKLLINLSNSAYDELRKRDKEGLSNVVRHIETLAKK